MKNKVKKLTYSVRLTDRTHRLLAYLGRGSLSTGINEALKLAKVDIQASKDAMIRDLKLEIKILEAL